MKRQMRKKTFLVLLAWLALRGLSAAAQTPDQIWNHFVEWGRNPPANPGNKSMMDLYVEQLLAEGVPKEEAERRAKLISGELRQKSRANNVLFWDTMFRIRSGPERPLKLLAETIRELPPGRALDVAMGNGRNAAFLAAQGWQVTGYDISPEALAIARRRAAALGVSYEIVLSDHRSFDFGRERWDLVLLSYIVADEGDLDLVFGKKLWDSLRPGARVLCEGNFCEPLVRTLFSLTLPGFRLERYSDREEMREDWGSGSVKGRVIRAVVRKEP
jgi:SAM-dependent methyltransferase